MRRLLVICFLFFLHVPGIAQQFIFKQSKSSSIDVLQNGDNARRITYDYSIGVAEDYFPNRKNYRLAQPVNFVRTDKTSVRVEQFFIPEMLRIRVSVSCRITAPELTAKDSLASFLIRDAINSRREASPLYYIDSSISFWPLFSQFAKHRRVVGFADLRKGLETEMKFSKRELKDVDNQMGAVRRREWPEQFFSNSVRLNEDSLATFRNYMSSPEYRMNGIGKWIYYFSQPVFIRNNSVAIFQLWEMIGHSSGNNLIFVYTKNEQGWTRTMAIHAGSW